MGEHADLEALSDETAEILREDAEIRRDLGLDGPEEMLAGDGWKDGRIADLSGLDWALRKMAEKERLMSENRALVEREIARLRQWEAGENATLERARRNLEAHIRVYAEANRSALGKTRRLPHGVVAWKERKEGAYRLDPNMTDHAARKALLEWSAEYEKWHELDAPLTIQKPALDLERVKEFLLAASREGRRVETPAGLEWVPPGERLTISVEEEKR